MKQKVPLRLDLDGGDGGKEEEELMAGEETVSTQYGADPAVVDMGAKETDDGDIDEGSVHHPLPSTASQSSVPSRKRKTPVPPQPPESPGARSSTVYSGLIGTPSEEEPVYPVPAFEASRSSRASRHEVDWVSSEADCGFPSLNLSLDIESLMASGYAPPPPPRPPPAVDTTPAGPALELESLMASGSAPPPPPPLPAVDTTPAGLALDQLREESTKKEPIAKGTLSKSIVLGPSRKSGSTEPEVADMSMLPQTEKVQAVKNLETSDNSLEAPVCALVDVMYKLPAKLDGVLRHGHMLPKGAENEIPLIKQDLELMVAVLHDYNNSGAENCAIMIKCLMKEVRELAYDIEDCIDQYENAIDSRSRPVFRIPRRLITRRKSKASRLPKKLKKRLWMANKIREFSMRSQEALQRYILFNPEGISTASPSSSSTNSRKKISTASTRYDASFGSWHPTPYGESAAHPVGIDAPMSKLKVWLAKDGEQNVKVISIVGSGGIGKTTLANELYHTIGGQFECRAFVRTSQKPDIKRLLISILSQVRPHRPQHTWKVHNLISDIRTHLQDKRYLIIIDDVWSTSTWDIVSRALPESNHCSRIIITTEIEDVALRCCAYDPKYVFMLKPLSNDDSRILFFNTAFGCEHECSPDLLEVSSNIIKKCGGLPLALVTIASVLASRMGKLGQWDYINKSLGYGLRTNPTVDGMKQVVNLSYDNLPWHLKVCLLYLSMYQEDWILWRDDLVKQWIAEGFICATEDEDKEEIARRYFDELISSRMIQPAHINYNDEVLSCTVHHMVLNLITHKSIEENFIIAIDHSQTTARLADKVRRLSLHFGNSEDATLPTNMRLSQLRTLAFFGVFKSMPSIMEFQLLRVLVLQLWGDEENMSLDLTRISDLFRLRYFQVTSNVTLELRTQMQGLQYLETLKMDARLSVVPSDFCLPGLLHLNIPAGTKLPEGIFRMTSLRTLGYVDLNINSIENVHSLGELTNLQDLHLTYMAVPSGYLVGNMEFLGSILGKLSNLKSLTLVSAGSSHLCTTNAPYNPAGMIFSGDGLSSMPCPPALLHRLELPHICIFSSLPRWIRGLANLRILKIAVGELSKNDVDVLKKLPVLTVLSLYVATVPSERIAFDRTGFLLLRYFEFRCTMPWLKFEANAMPNLWKLKLGFSAHGNVCYGAMPVGIEYLSVLKEVSAKIWCVGPEESNRMTAESALRDTLRLHPGRLRVEVQHVDKMFDGQDDKSSVTKEDHRALKQCDMLVDDRNEQFDVLQKNMGEDANKQADGWGLSSVGKGTSSTSFVENLAEGEAPWSIAFPLESPSTRFDLRPGESMATIQRPLILPHSERRRTDDGYNWRKYGQTQVKGSENPRSYYKCAFPSCPAKKKVERSLDNQIIEIVYKGRHNHPKPHNTDSENFGDANSGISGTTFEEPGSLDDHPTTRTGIRSEVLDDREAARQMLMCAHTRFQFNQRPEESMAAIQSPLALIPQHSERRSADDGYNWRKYGQTQVKGSENLRSYSKCAFPSCPAKKKVERSLANHIIEILYKGRHNHPKPHSTGRYSGKMLHSSHEDFGDANSGITGTTFEEPGSSDDESPWTGILSEVLPVG